MAEEKKDGMMALTEVKTGELAVSYDQARAQKEIEGAIVSAKRFPRDEMTMLTRILKACQRPMFAAKARYIFPRGKTDVSGGSVKLAREMARLWGNIRYGFEVVRDDDISRKLRGVACDLESNATVVMEVEFKKLVLRKPKDANGNTYGKAEWVVPDERDLRELTNRHGAILERNCIFKLMPPDFVIDAEEECKKTSKGEIKQDREGILKKLVKAFDELAITPAMIEGRYGYPVAQLTEDDIDELRGIFESIKDGNSKRDEYFGVKKADTATGSIGLDDLTPGEVPHKEIRDVPGLVEKIKADLEGEDIPVDNRELINQLKALYGKGLVLRDDLTASINLSEYDVMKDPANIRENIKSSKATEWKNGIGKLIAWLEKE
jgi:hypothetical protein